MFTNLLQNFFGSTDDRYLKGLKASIEEINSLEKHLEKFSDQELTQQTSIFRKKLQDGVNLDSLIPEAFATVREASKRVTGLRHYDVQLMGGIVLHRGNVAEMATGEGKTLVSTLPVYLNALGGKGVHIVTVNDYLAKRDSESTSKIYEFLGLSVGCITNNMEDEERKKQYQCDVTYATNNELGFDYLRDNMKFNLNEVVQKNFSYAIVDEVDSILIDEARTPLIISGPVNDSSKLYNQINKIIPSLTESDYEKEEKNKSITFTEEGNHSVEKLLQKEKILQEGSLYDLNNISLIHHVNQALRAHKMFHKDVDYIVKDNQVIIIDEFTGRMMDGRRYSDGLHQALEAKENVVVQMENQTLASITFQNYFRLYDKLAGMTGTAKTEAAELSDIYNLEVISIKTNVPIIRKDNDDEIYRTSKEKLQAIAELIKKCNERKQPVLVGTTSIEKSEELSDYLNKLKIKHQVLNARFHEKEATIIAQAGSPRAVTIATNMAGRGTDIKLGGSLEDTLSTSLNDNQSIEEKKSITEQLQKEIAEKEEIVKKAGGLCVIGTERHESRRVDNQLRGRSGRQGDPGMSKFFLSLDDDLMRIFGSNKLDTMLQKLGLKDGEAITHPWVNKALERAQQKVEARNYDIRKHLLKYDDVMNEQRKIIYAQRKDFIQKNDLSKFIIEMQEDIAEDLLNKYLPENSLADQWNIQSLHTDMLRIYALDLPFEKWVEKGLNYNDIYDNVLSEISNSYNQKKTEFPEEVIKLAEKTILLRNLDTSWKEHLLALDHLRQGINLRAVAQRNPLNEYKQEAFVFFEEMLNNIREATISTLSHLSINLEEEINTSDNLRIENPDISQLQYSGPDKSNSTINKTSKVTKSIKNRLAKIKNSSSSDKQRNTSCGCGSGKRYKHCCGKL